MTTIRTTIRRRATTRRATTRRATTRRATTRRATTRRATTRRGTTRSSTKRKETARITAFERRKTRRQKDLRTFRKMKIMEYGNEKELTREFTNCQITPYRLGSSGHDSDDMSALTTAFQNLMTNIDNINIKIIVFGHGGLPLINKTPLLFDPEFLKEISSINMILSEYCDIRTFGMQEQITALINGDYSNPINEVVEYLNRMQEQIPKPQRVKYIKSKTINAKDLNGVNQKIYFGIDDAYTTLINMGAKVGYPYILVTATIKEKPEFNYRCLFKAKHKMIDSTYVYKSAISKVLKVYKKCKSKSPNYSIHVDHVDFLCSDAVELKWDGNNYSVIYGTAEAAANPYMLN